MQGHAAITALVPAERIYPPQRPPNPTWPFIGYGMPVTVPFVASGVDGSAHAVAIHAYAETGGEGEATVMGDDLAQRIVAAIVDLLGGEAGCEIPLPDAPYQARATVTWTGSQCVQDGADASAFHAWATFDITVIS